MADAELLGDGERLLREHAVGTLARTTELLFVLIFGTEFKLPGLGKRLLEAVSSLVVPAAAGGDVDLQTRELEGERVALDLGGFELAATEVGDAFRDRCLLFLVSGEFGGEFSEGVVEEFEHLAGLFNRGRVGAATGRLAAKLLPAILDRDPGEMLLIEVAVQVADGSYQIMANNRAGEVVRSVAQV